MHFLKKNFKKIDDIYSNIIEDNITKNVVDFYNVKPFPNYRREDNKASILKKGNKNYLAKKFKEFAGFNKKILEVGCGTGQLSIFFSGIYIQRRRSGRGHTFFVQAGQVDNYSATHPGGATQP